ncbi:MAG: DsbE family thiol:disulfide interchange protein [Hyphomonadaceae bacterium]
MMRRWWTIAPLLLLALIAAAAFFVLSRGHERAAHFEPRIGRPAPAYALAALTENGAPVTPAAFAGKAYVINLFASWCAPCRAEQPILMALKAEGAPILGVAYKDAPAAARRMLLDLGDPYALTALDPEGDFGLDLGVAGVPETFVIGADGRIRAVIRGPLTEAAVRREILPALRGGA